MRMIAAALLSTALLACAEQPTSPAGDGAQFTRLDDTDQGGMLFTTAMSGAEEAPVAGDPDGTGWFTMTINPGQGTICYELSVENIAPATAAHIHIAAAGVAGPVRVTLVPPTSGSSSACTSVGATATFTEALLKDLRKNPTAYYVNVHNAVYPAGAVRGQLGD